MASIASAVAQPFDPAALLHRATDDIDAAADRLHDFTCIETIRRSLYRRHGLIERASTAADIPTAPGARDVIIWSDRLRVEVAMIHGNQLFSWPGDAEFRYRDAGELAGGGAASAGEFGPFGISVLLSDADPMSLRFRGLTDSGLAEYGYSVPRSTSHFTVQGGAHEEMTTAYEGSFFIDPRTADLRRLIVAIVHAPPGSEIVGGRIVIDYGPQQMEQTLAWLPRASTLRMLNERGDLVVNDSEYGDCRQFRSESTLSFESAPDQQAPGTAPVSTQPLPAGLVLHTVIETPIDIESSSAGEEVRVRVVKPVRRKGQLLIPADARVFGRVVELRRIFQPSAGVALAIRFDRIESNGNSRPISLASLGPAGSGGPISPRGLPRAATIAIAGTTKLHIAKQAKWDWETR